MNTIDKFKFYLNIIISHTLGAIYALIKGKKIKSLSNAYIEYFENYLFSPDGINYDIENTLPLYGKYSFENWVKYNNYYIKLSRNINLERSKNLKCKILYRPHGSSKKQRL